LYTRTRRSHRIHYYGMISQAGEPHSLNMELVHTQWRSSSSAASGETFGRSRNLPVPGGSGYDPGNLSLPVGAPQGGRGLRYLISSSFC
jgi:hypothetical protein